MLKEDIIKSIELIDEQIAKDKEAVEAHGGLAAQLLLPTMGLLADARQTYVDMLWYEYGVLYI